MAAPCVSVIARAITRGSGLTGRGVALLHHLAGGGAAAGARRLKGRGMILEFDPIRMVISGVGMCAIPRRMTALAVGDELVLPGSTRREKLQVTRLARLVCRGRPRHTLWTGQWPCDKKVLPGCAPQGRRVSNRRLFL